MTDLQYAQEIADKVRDGERARVQQRVTTPFRPRWSAANRPLCTEEIETARRVECE
jgi:hypothetical protein